jgi:protein TonB
MDIEAWSGEEAEPGRKRRLAIGYVTGIATCLLVGGVVLGAAGEARSAAAEEEVEVKLATTVEVDKPPPPPPPPPTAVAAPPAAKRSLPAVPKEIPDDKPPELDPSQAKEKIEGDPNGVAGGVVGGVAGGVPGGTGTAPAPAAPPPPPPPPPPPKATGPMQLPEDAEPPQAVANAQPAYPADARSQSIEATVVVKFVITESGQVTNVKIVRGHPMFDAAVLAAVQGWRYRPAIYQGKPISTFKVVRIPFKIRT